MRSPALRQRSRRQARRRRRPARSPRRSRRRSQYARASASGVERARALQARRRSSRRSVAQLARRCPRCPCRRECRRPRSCGRVRCRAASCAASVCAAAGLWATSRIHSTSRLLRTTWKRPGKRHCLQPALDRVARDRQARSASASSTASTAAALSNWIVAVQCRRRQIVDARRCATAPRPALAVARASRNRARVAAGPRRSAAPRRDRLRHVARSRTSPAGRRGKCPPSPGRSSRRRDRASRSDRARST